MIQRLYETLGVGQSARIPETRVLYLRTDDTVVTACDRLDWSGDKRWDRSNGERAVLVIPPEAAVLFDRLDLLRIQRHAARQRIGLALVAVDPDQRAVARALKLPVFVSVERAQRSPWRARFPLAAPTPALPRFEDSQGRVNPADLRPRDSRVSGYILAGMVAGVGLVLLYDVLTLSQLEPRQLGKDAMFGLAGGVAAGLLFFLIAWLLQHYLPELFRWLRRGFTVAVFAFGILSPILAGYVVVPGARLTLIPARRAVSAIARITVVVPPPGQEGGLEEIDFEGQRISGRRVSAEVGAEGVAATTGTAEVPSSRATGTVVFTNLLAQDYTIGRGTAVRTSAGTPVRFLTTGDVTVPPSGQAAVGIEAVEPGPEGNVGVGLINGVEGAAARAVRVTNPEPTRGGGVSQVRAVTQTDREDLRRSILAQLRAQGHQRVLERPEAEGGLREGEYLVPGSVRVFEVLHETYDRFASEEAESVRMEMRVLVTGVVVDLADAYNLARHVLERRVPAGYQLIDVVYRPGLMGDNVIGDGTLTFFVEVDGVAEAQLEHDVLKRQLRGKPLQEGVALLHSAREQDELAVAETPEVEIWPDWAANRFPWLIWRIQVIEAASRPVRSGGGG